MKNEKRIIEYLWFNKEPSKIMELAKNLDITRADAVDELRIMKGAGMVRCGQRGHDYWLTDKGSNMAVTKYGFSHDEKYKGETVKETLAEDESKQEMKESSRRIVEEVKTVTVDSDCQDLMPAKVSIQNKNAIYTNKDSDLIDEWAARKTPTEFRAIMIAQIEKYSRRYGKKDLMGIEAGKIADYARRLHEYESSRLLSEKD